MKNFSRITLKEYLGVYRSCVKSGLNVSAI